MTKTAVREAKEQVVSEIKEKVEASNISFIAEYRGMKMSDMTSLRKQIRQDGGQMKVYKNTMSRLALKALDIEFQEAILEGPSALITTTGDLSKVSKIVVKFSKETEQFKIRGGILENAIVTEVEIKALAELPSREELIAKVVGGIKAPLTSFVTALSSPLRGLVYTLEAVKNKKENNH